MVNSITPVIFPHILVNTFRVGEREVIFYGFKDWQKLPLIALFSDRNLDFKDGKEKDWLCKILGIKEESIVIPHQKHEGKADLVDGSDRKKLFSCDALVTSGSHIAMGVLTADCLSLFLYDPEHAAVGIVHAGWRGSSLGIAKNCVEMMKRKFLTEPEYLKIAIGPGIRKCCFEVKADLLEHFPEYIEKREGRLFLDPVAVNIKQLVSLGVKKENIIDSEICSVCHKDKFFSYRH
ncbi:MAG: polyphenol oxidase family protein, partial [Candidatus Omnitrophica bacterium]|nr:polyphenol oxidase family protein [Candidatus Omnitrophota bacterium]